MTHTTRTILSRNSHTLLLTTVRYFNLPSGIFPCPVQWMYCRGRSGAITRQQFHTNKVAQYDMAEFWFMESCAEVEDQLCERTKTEVCRHIIFIRFIKTHNRLVLFQKPQGKWGHMQKSYFHSYKFPWMAVKTPLNISFHINTFACSAAHYTCHCKDGQQQGRSFYFYFYSLCCIHKILNTREAVKALLVPQSLVPSPAGWVGVLEQDL